MPRISSAHILTRIILVDRNNVDISRQAKCQYNGCTIQSKLKLYKPKLNKKLFWRRKKLEHPWNWTEKKSKDLLCWWAACNHKLKFVFANNWWHTDWWQRHLLSMKKGYQAFLNMWMECWRLLFCSQITFGLVWKGVVPCRIYPLLTILLYIPPWIWDFTVFGLNKIPEAKLTADLQGFGSDWKEFGLKLSIKPISIRKISKQCTVSHSKKSSAHPPSEQSVICPLFS